VIARVTAAKKIFLSNLGADRLFLQFIPGGPNGTYDELYATLKQWGRFQLVDSPSEADLIFDIRSSTIGGEYVVPGGLATIARDTTGWFDPIFTLSIIDPSTHASIYSVQMLAGRGSNKPKGKIAFSESISYADRQDQGSCGCACADAKSLASYCTARDSWLKAAKSLAASGGVAGPSAAQLARCASCFAQDDSSLGSGVSRTLPV
jgi:hypothetical protein